MVLKRRSTGDIRIPETTFQDPFPGWSHSPPVLLPRRGGRSGPATSVPMGGRTDPDSSGIQPLYRFPPVLSTTPGTPLYDSPSPIDRRDIVPIPQEKELVELVGMSPPGQIMMGTNDRTRTDLIRQLNVPGISSPDIIRIRKQLSDLGVQGGVTNIINSNPPEAAVDLGTIYDAVDTVLGGWLPGGVPLGSSVPGTGFGQNYPVATGGGGGGGVIINTPTQMPAPGPGPGGGGDCGPYPVMKRVCGQYKWVYPKRRRRKMFFTQGDAAQLSSLLSIAGKGEIAKAWIATSKR